MNKKEKQELVQSFLTDVGDFSFDVNKWGSCQYSGALAAYDAYFKIRDYLSQTETIKFLNDNFQINIKFSQKDISIKNLIKEFTDDAKKHYSSDPEWLEEILEGYLDVESVDDIFTAFREQSDDLWCAAPSIAEKCFDSLDIQIPVKESGLEKGPIGNIMAQSENLSTGLYCALLKDYGFVKDEKSFADFDT